MRDKMKAFMLDQIGDLDQLHNSSRYRSVFYRVNPDASSKARTRMMKRATEYGSYDIETIDELSDDDFLEMYNRFMRRYFTWM